MFKFSFLILYFIGTAGYAAMPANERIQSHLRFVYDLISNRNLNSLTVTQLENRRNGLRALKSYYELGQFPQNHDYPGVRVPYFIDEHGTPCAVAHIMIASGHQALAYAIAHKNNHLYLDQIEDPVVLRWIANSGFTFDELRLIQPGYRYKERFKDPLFERAYLGDDKKVRQILSEEKIPIIRLNLALQVAAQAADARLLIKKPNTTDTGPGISHDPPPWVGHWVEVVTMLMAKGADPQAKNSKGQSAIDLAKDPDVKAALNKSAKIAKLRSNGKIGIFKPIFTLSIRYLPRHLS